MTNNSPHNRYYYVMPDAKAPVLPDIPGVLASCDYQLVSYAGDEELAALREL